MGRTLVVLTLLIVQSVLSHDRGQTVDKTVPENSPENTRENLLDRYPARSREDPARGDPAGDDPAEDDPSGDYPAGDDPAGDDPAGDGPAGDDPAGDGPAGDDPAGEGPAGDDPAGEGPAGDGPAGDDPAGEDPAGDDPAGEGPAGEGPAGDDPAGEDPAGEGPAGDDPAGDDPAGDDPAGDDPAGDDPSVEPTGPPDLQHHGWNNVSAQEDIMCNLVTTPLQIKTEGPLDGQKEISVEVGFVSGARKALVIKLETSPHILISECTESPLPLTNVSHLSGVEVIVWTISKSGSTLTIYSNNVQSLVYNFSNSTTNCSALWQQETTHVTFSASDTASDERRLKPTNCTAIPGDWHKHVLPDKVFPVGPGTEVGVTCIHGDWNIGDSSIICNTNLYTDFEYSKTPWCVGMKTAGSEVMEGATTTLTCRLSNLPREGSLAVGWSLNGQETTVGVETGEVVYGELTSTVVVQGSSAEMDYWCEIQGHEDWRRPTVLNVFSIRDASKDTRVGETSFLGCYVHNITVHPRPPTIVWKLGEQVLKNGPKYMIKTEMHAFQHSASSYLEVKDPTEDTNFTCHVTSGLYPASPAGATVITLNTFTMSTECMMRSKEHDVVACQVEDIDEAMQISWYKGDVQLPGDLQLFERGVQRSVLFLSPGTAEEDTYTCRVKSIQRPESATSYFFVKVATIEREESTSSLLKSPVIWCLVVAAVALCAAVGVLSGYVLKVRRSMKTLTFRLSTREKLDSLSQRPDTILRNRTAPQVRDIESLRRTLDRKSPAVHMSDVTDKSFEEDVVFD
ncbi:hypothetical protein ACHWQZ_G004367 [Mnemiopsis leidyi]